MANSIYKVHEMINKVGWDIEDIDTKRVISIAEKAGDLMSKGLVQEAGVAFDELGKMFNKKLQEMGKASIDFTDMIQMPDDSTLEKMTSGFTSAIASNIKNGIIAGIRGGEVEIKTLLKDLTELEAAYNRNKNKTGAKTGKRVKSGLVNRTQEAFAYEPSDTAIKIGNNLRSIANEFNRATNWEDQYVSLLKYIKAYEALEKVSTDPKALGKWSKIGDYTIEDLKAARPEIEHSLQNIFNVAYDKAVTGLTSVGDIDLGVKLTPIKMIDVYDVTEGKGYIEVEVKPVVKKARKNVVPNMYRGVHRPNADPTEGSIEGKTVNRETLGGNYWVAPESQGFVARAYGEESGLDDAKTIKAHANALNKIRVEAIKDGMSLLFNEIDKIDLLQYLFPGVENFKNVADPEGYDLTQKFYNEMARQSGFDLLEIFQVNEGGDEIANTMVTLQNRIIEYIGNIPKYLDVEKFTPEMEQHIISQQKGSSERWYDQTIARLEQELENAIRNDDAGAQKKLQTIIPQVKQMREEAMNAFDDAIVSYGGYVAEEVQRGLPQVITKDEDGNLIARITEESLKARLVKYKDLMAVPEDDDGYDQAQSEMEEIYNQIISSLPKRLQSDADNLLNDFAYGDKSTDDAMQYFAPHLAYKEPVLSDTTRDTSRVAEATKEILTQVKALEKLSERINSSGKVPSQFFDDIIADSQLLDEELKDVLSALNMMDDQGNLNLKSIHNGFSNLGGAVSDAYTVISRAGDYMPKAQDLMPKLVDAEAMGANVGTIVDVFEDKISGRIYELQKTMPGTIIPDNTDFLEATDEQIIKLIRDLEILHKTGLYIDFGNDNILYDKEKGFSFIDLATRFQEGQETTGSTAQELLNSLNPVFADNTLFGDFENKLTNIANSLGVIIPQAAEKARQSMDNFGNLGASTGTDDTSSAELEALRQQLKAKDAEISEANRKREEAELAERVAQDEVAAERHATDAAEDRAAMYDSAMKSMQEEMDGLREQLTNRASGVGDASLEELRAAQDEAEKLRQEKLRLLESNEDLRSDLESTRSYYGSALWEEEHRANQAEAEVERLKQQLTEKSGTNGLPGSGDHIDMTDEQAQLMILKDAVEAVTAAVNAKTESFKNESTVVDSSVNTEIAKLVELENKLTAIKSTLEGLLNNIKSGADDIGAGLSNIAVNVNHQSDENLKIDIPALTDAISNIQVTPDNEGLIAEIKIVAAGLGTLVAQDETLQAIKNEIETKGNSASEKIPPEVKAETSTNRERRFERLTDFASLYEDVEDVDAAIREFGELYKEIILVGDEATKVIRPNKTGINTLRKIANGDINPEYDYSWVEFKRNNPSTGEDKTPSSHQTVAIDAEELKNVLNAITYKVKVMQDEDGADNKVSIDEASLEAILNKVFANILNPKTQQNDLESEQEPWLNVETSLGTLVAQDETLQAIKNAIEANGHSVDIDKVLDVLQNIPKNTGSNRNADINPHYLTDPHGKVVTAYRGIRDNYGGLVSNRYHGGTFSTDDIELAKVYAGELGKIEKVFLSMKNPLEIDGQGAQWDRIEYLGHGADEASRKLIELTKNIKILEDYYLSHPTGDVVHPLTGELMHDIESIREEILELRNLKEQISQDPTNPYGVGTTNHFAELAKANGYDGVIFKNVYDGLQKASNIMVTFEQDQIHYIETIGANATEAFKQLHSQAGDFNKYINITDDDITGLVERLRQIHGEINTLMFELYSNPDALEAAFQESKGKYIDTDPALKALYDAKLAPRDLPDDYLQLPGFVGSPFFDAEGLEIIFKRAIEFARNELNRIQTEFGTTATNIDEYQSEIDGQVDVKQEPWALESTLQAVKGVLDNIQTNTANIGVAEASTADPIAGTTLDGRLTAIKSILESINNKIVEGGVIFTSGDGRRGTKDAGSKGKPARTTQFNSLIKDYENIGRLSAQFANDGNLETKAKIDLLKKEIETKRASLKLSIDENLVLRQKYRAAFEAQKKLLDAAKAQKAIDDKRKAADDDAKKHEKDADIERKEQAKAQASRQSQVKSLAKDYEKLGKLAAQFDDDGNLETKAKLELLKEEIKTKRASLKLSIDENLILRQQYSAAFDAQKRLLEAAKTQKGIDDQWKKQVKDAQRATGINAATSAANAGDQTVLRTIGANDVSDDISQKAKKLSDQIKALRALRDEIDQKGKKASEEDRSKLSKQIASVKTLKSELDGYLKIHEKYSGDDVTDLGDASNFGAVGSNEYWNNITAAAKAQAEGRVAIKGLNADTGELTGTTKIAANTFATWSATVDPLTGRLSMLRTGIKKTETLVESITRKTKEIFTYFSGSSIIFKFFNEVRRGIQYIREIDLALTELKKVTDETEETYDRFLATAAKTGARLGATISAVTGATATFAKLGYDMATATEMAEAAIVYKNVGDNIASTEDAADSIISTLKGFGMEASESMAIVDRFNEVGNRFAITSQGIGEALRLSASALNEGGNSLDESIAMITAANEVVNDPSAVGTALKTLTLRLRGSKTELEEMGEDVSDMATTTSQLQAKLLALTGGQVDIMVNPTTFKNSTQILREMAEAWEDMNDIQRAEWCPYVQKCA